jgi:hypothetical protein
VPPTAPFPEEHWNKRACALIGAYNGPIAEGQKLMAQLLESLPAPLFNWMGEMPFPAINGLFDPFFPKGLQWYWKGDFVKALSDEAIAAHIANAVEAPTPFCLMHLYPIDGAVRRVGKDATPWGARDASFSMVIAGISPSRRTPGPEDLGRAYWRRCTFNMEGGVNFMGDDGRPTASKASYGDNYKELAAVKGKYDPNNLFQVNQNIKPARAEGRRASHRNREARTGGLRRRRASLRTYARRPIRAVVLTGINLFSYLDRGALRRAPVDQRSSWGSATPRLGTVATGHPRLHGDVAHLRRPRRPQAAAPDRARRLIWASPPPSPALRAASCRSSRRALVGVGGRPTAPPAPALLPRLAAVGAGGSSPSSSPPPVGSAGYVGASTWAGARPSGWRGAPGLLLALLAARARCAAARDAAAAAAGGEPSGSLPSRGHRHRHLLRNRQFVSHLPRLRRGPSPSAGSACGRRRSSSACAACRGRVEVTFGASCSSPASSAPSPVAGCRLAPSGRASHTSGCAASPRWPRRRPSSPEQDRLHDRHHHRHAARLRLDRAGQLGDRRPGGATERATAVALSIVVPARRCAVAAAHRLLSGSSLGQAFLIVPVAILLSGAIWSYAAWRGARLATAAT